jgi:hypothetical protein
MVVFHDGVYRTFAEQKIRRAQQTVLDVDLYVDLLKASVQQLIMADLGSAGKPARWSVRLPLANLGPVLSRRTRRWTTTPLSRCG